METQLFHLSLFFLSWVISNKARIIEIIFLLLGWVIFWKLKWEKMSRDEVLQDITEPMDQDWNYIKLTPWLTWENQWLYCSTYFYFIFWSCCQHITRVGAAAAAAKSLQSCLTLCNPIDSSPPGSAVPGILQARILEWVAISFSKGWEVLLKTTKSILRIWNVANLKTWKKLLAHTAIIKYHRLGDLKNRNVFLTLPEPQEFKIKVLTDLVSGESLLPGLQMSDFSLCTDMALPLCADTWSKSKLSGIAFYKDSKPIGSGPYSYDLIWC